MAFNRVEKRETRKFRIRKKITGTADRPRLTVYRSLRYVYAQLIDDLTGKTLAQANSLDLKKGAANKDAATKVGQLIAERAKALKIEKVSFDRNGFLYHGVIHSLAEAARKAGLQF